MKTTAIPQLDYAPRPRKRRRWIKRIFVAFLVLSNLYFAYDKWGERVRLQVHMLLAQRRCMRYSLPPTKIALSTDPSQVNQLLSQGYGQSPSFFGSGNLSQQVTFYPAMKNAFDAFETASENIDGGYNVSGGGGMGGVFANSPISNPEYPVFVHERRSHSRHVRLIQCAAEVASDGQSIQIRFMAAAIEPASLTGLRKWCEPSHPTEPLLLLQPGDQRWLRLFAGQTDPQNDSRFTIKYEMTDGSGSIEGMLNDDDSVRLRVIDKPPRSVTPTAENSR